MWYNLQGEGKGKDHIRCGSEKKSLYLADGIANNMRQYDLFIFYMLNKIISNCLIFVFSIYFS